MLLLMVIITVSVANAVELASIPFDSPRWQVDAEESRVEQYLGRTSLYLYGGIALVSDSDMLDGVIEFDIAFGPERGFAGATWRVQDLGNREQFYMRAHQSGNPDANQYTPVFNDQTAWQLYHGEGYGTPVEYPFHTWIPVRIVVAGSQAEIFVNDLETPALFADDLKRVPKPGQVGLTAARFAPAHFSNFRFAAMDPPPAFTAPLERQRQARPGSIMAWSISDPFSEERIDGMTELTEEAKDGLTWSKLACESSGLANISRLHPLERPRNTVFSRVSLASDTDQVVGLELGYSDRIRVFLNDRLLYSGDNGYRTRDYRYLGTIGYFDQVFLPLRKGQNELSLAVSETFGGWGVQAALSDSTGIRVGIVEEDAVPEPVSPADTEMMRHRVGDTVLLPASFSFCAPDVPCGLAPLCSRSFRSAAMLCQTLARSIGNRLRKNRASSSQRSGRG
jgi:hypothetical protein